MTFFEKGRLIKVKIASRPSLSFMHGKIGMVCYSSWAPRGFPVSVSLLIEGSIHRVTLYEEDVQFL